VTIVIDASIAVKWVLPEPRTDAALALRNEQLVAPVLWLVEAANALWRHVRLGELTGEQALALMSELEKAPVASIPIEPHVAHALELGARANHPVYDCIYLAVALHQRTYVVTDDRRFAAAAARVALSDHVRLLGST
jgi:predicted nucleic acid-binding protein